jgi:hypothetical protein
MNAMVGVNDDRSPALLRSPAAVKSRDPAVCMENVDPILFENHGDFFETLAIELLAESNSKMRDLVLSGLIDQDTSLGRADRHFELFPIEVFGQAKDGHLSAAQKGAIDHL